MSKESENETAESTPLTYHYFVDEAGDGTLFNRGGKPLVGTEGCSRFFMVGLLRVEDPFALTKDLDELRASLLADPYFSNVPSMQPHGRKTAAAFHAKDDLPEVRREVFKKLLDHDLRFFAVVRDKAEVMNYVRMRNERDCEYRYHPDHLYDLTVARLFKDKLHKPDSCHITFAKRGGADRTEAFRKAIDVAMNRFEKKWGKATEARIDIVCSTPHRSGGLQAADYFLWALQRLYTRREDRFVKLLWPKFRQVIDVDDLRENRYGTYYSKKRILTAESLPQQEERGI